MLSERELQISPIVQESVMHNSRILYNLQSLTASLFGVCAGILGLESHYGFLFFAACSVLTSFLFYALRIAPSSTSSSSGSGSSSSNTKSPLLDTSQFFRGSSELWTGGLFNGLAGFILTWTLFYGLVRA